MKVWDVFEVLDGRLVLLGQVAARNYHDALAAAVAAFPSEKDRLYIRHQH